MIPDKFIVRSFDLAATEALNFLQSDDPKVTQSRLHKIRSDIEKFHQLLLTHFPDLLPTCSTTTTTTLSAVAANRQQSPNHSFNEEEEGSAEEDTDSEDESLINNNNNKNRITLPSAEDQHQQSTEQENEEQVEREAENAFNWTFWTHELQNASLLPKIIDPTTLVVNATLVNGSHDGGDDATSSSNKSLNRQLKARRTGSRLLPTSGTPSPTTLSTSVPATTKTTTETVAAAVSSMTGLPLSRSISDKQNQSQQQHQLREKDQSTTLTASTATTMTTVNPISSTNRLKRRLSESNVMDHSAEKRIRTMPASSSSGSSSSSTASSSTTSIELTTTAANHQQVHQNGDEGVSRYEHQDQPVEKQSPSKTSKSTKRKSKKSKKGKTENRRSAPYDIVKRMKPAFAEFCGKEMASRREALRLTWDYIRANKLQPHENNRNFITFDDTLQKALNTNLTSINKAATLSSHVYSQFVKEDDAVVTVAPASAATPAPSASNASNIDNQPQAAKQTTPLQPKSSILSKPTDTITGTSTSSQVPTMITHRVLNGDKANTIAVRANFGPSTNVSGVRPYVPTVPVSHSTVPEIMTPGGSVKPKREVPHAVNSSAAIEFFGTTVITPENARKKIWEHIKKNQLQMDKNIIVVDDVLRKAFSIPMDTITAVPGIPTICRKVLQQVPSFSNEATADIFANNEKLVAPDRPPDND